jgi:hypothetical protein
MGGQQQQQQPQYWQQFLQNIYGGGPSQMSYQDAASLAFGYNPYGAGIQAATQPRYTPPTAPATTPAAGPGAGVAAPAGGDGGDANPENTIASGGGQRRGGRIGHGKDVRAALLTARGMTGHSPAQPVTTRPSMMGMPVHPAKLIPGIHVVGMRPGHFAEGGDVDASPAPIEAWHGSPHTFRAERLVEHPTGQREYIQGGLDRLPDVPQGAKVLRDFPLGRFRDTQIGTGEGAQAYGHGHYSAGKEGVARGYRDALTQGDVDFAFDGKGHHRDELESFDAPEYHGIAAMMHHNFDASAARKSLVKETNPSPSSKETPEDIRRWLSNWNENVTDSDVAQEIDRRDLEARASALEMKDAVKWFDANHARITPPPERNKGSLYHLAIHANPDHFLDWDAPLSEQHPRVQEFARNVDLSHLKPGNRPRTMLEWFKQGKEQPHSPATGEILHDALSGFGRPRPEAAAALRAAGIPGVKYFDAGSRSAGQGTRNYVVFDPNLIEIKHRYARGGGVGHPHPAHFADGGAETQGLPQPSEALAPSSRAMPFSIAPAPGFVPQAMTQSTRNLTEPGTVTIKSMADAFNKAIDNHLSLPPGERITNFRQAANNMAEFLGRGKSGKINALIRANGKLEKAARAGEGGGPISLPDGRGVETIGLALMPDFKEGQFRVCGNADVCRDTCLGKKSGQYQFDPTQTQTEFPTTKQQEEASKRRPRMASLRRTHALMRDPESFAVYLHELIGQEKENAARRGNHLGVRLNVLSDLHPSVMAPIIKANPDVTFYDYTKMNYDPIAPNHHYTYSSTGLTQPDRGVNNPFQNWHKMRARLDRGDNVAMPFAHKSWEAFPKMMHDEETGRHYRVVSGDEHDFRPLDLQPHGKAGVIVALRNLAGDLGFEKATKETKGFFVHHDPQFLKNNRGSFAKDQNGNRIPRNLIYNVPVQPAKRYTPPVIKRSSSNG